MSDFLPAISAPIVKSRWRYARSGRRQPAAETSIAQVVPSTIIGGRRLVLPQAQSEVEALALDCAPSRQKRPDLRRASSGRAMSGTGDARRHPANILENPAWYTAYAVPATRFPRGRLEALLSYRTMICDLTGMDIASSSLLDEGTAAAEAMTLAKRQAKSTSNTIIVAGDCHPQTSKCWSSAPNRLALKSRSAWRTS